MAAEKALSIHKIDAKDLQGVHHNHNSNKILEGPETDGRLDFNRAHSFKDLKFERIARRGKN